MPSLHSDLANLLCSFYSGLFQLSSTHLHVPPTQSLATTEQSQHRKQVWTEVSVLSAYQGKDGYFCRNAFCLY